MFLIDLNHCYFKVVCGGNVWAHDLDELQWLVPDNESVHVRKGKGVAEVPLSALYQWLFPFGPFDINSDSYPEEYIDQVLKRRQPVGSEDDDWDDWAFNPDEPLPCRTYHCDGTCEICSDARRRSEEYMNYHTRLEAEWFLTQAPERAPEGLELNDDFGPDEIPFSRSTP